MVYYSKCNAMIGVKKMIEHAKMPNIKKAVLIVITLIYSVSGVGCGDTHAENALLNKEADAVTSAPKKVIYDTDMMYLNDDSIALFMLTQADTKGELELLGVTTVGGNVFEAASAEATLTLLELIGRDDIPVYRGTDIPLAGFRNMREEEKLYGATEWCGAYWDLKTNDYVDIASRPTDYLNLGYEPMYGYPSLRAQNKSAWDYMIEQVHKYPGEVTIMAVGAATNVATAIQKDPSFVNDAAGIIYMGGDIDVPGNASAAAEFNWFYDPDAIKLCLESDWKSQIVVPDDLARQVHMEISIFDRLRKKGNNKITELILTKEEGFVPGNTNYVWDVVVPAIFLHPEIMTDLQTRYLTVDDNPGYDYGRAVSIFKNSHNDPATGEGMPQNVKPVQILMSIDEDAFWDFYVDILTY